MILSTPETFSIDNLHNAYLKCRKGKRGKIYIQVQPKAFYQYNTLTSQINFYKRAFNNKILLVQVGKFYEIHTTDLGSIQELSMKLKLKPYLKRNQTVLGFPKYKLRKTSLALKSNHCSGVLIKQTEDITHQIKARLPVLSWCYEC
jgi:hypothetical protein